GRGRRREAGDSPRRYCGPSPERRRPAWPPFVTSRGKVQSLISRFDLSRQNGSGSVSGLRPDPQFIARRVAEVEAPATWKAEDRSGDHPAGRAHLLEHGLEVV